MGDYASWGQIEDHPPLARRGEVVGILPVVANDSLEECEPWATMFLYFCLLVSSEVRTTLPSMRYHRAVTCGMPSAPTVQRAAVPGASIRSRCDSGISGTR